MRPSWIRVHWAIILFIPTSLAQSNVSIFRGWSSQVTEERELIVLAPNLNDGYKVVLQLLEGGLPAEKGYPAN